jgi:uncharacterized membrane protein YeaQ/YmgE (transglycosylase-associated protein family)
VETAPSARQRISAAVCALGLLYGVPALWIIVTLVRGDRASDLEKHYARSAPIFQGVVAVVGAVVGFVLLSIFGTTSPVPFVTLAILLLAPTAVTLLSVYRAARGASMRYPLMAWADRWVFG